MAPIHTLNSGSTVAENFQGRGYKLDSTRERELESEHNELLIKTEFFANKCSDFRNAKPENNSGASAKAHMSPLIESNTQMGPGPEALPPPIGAIPIFLTMPNICCSCKEPSSPLYTDCIVTHSFMVVGMRFRGGHKFKKSDTITLEPEPSNTYDKNAIKVMVDGIHKAYVAKDENVSIGDLMKKYPNYRITAHGKKNYNKSASLNLEYPWMHS
ncbi:6186_t:CDS:2 [Entrophospora sp. SA101]|nr:6186_t:CDS:2 [Entrophospora sp. SA101]